MTSKKEGIAVVEDGFGELGHEQDQAVIRFSRLFRHAPHKVWRALTEPDHLVAWFPTTVEGDRKPGAALHFGFRDFEGPSFDGEMLSFDPPKVMEMQWGDERLRFEVRPHGDGSLLLFTATFDELGKAARDGAGWHACLDLLAHEVNGAMAPWSAADRWREVCDIYVTRFGPDASTVGPPEGWENVHAAVDPSR